MELCAELKDELIKLARGEPMEERRRRDTQAHLACCLSCQESFEQQKWLSNTFAIIRQGAQATLPPHLGLQLRRDFDLDQSRRTRWRTAIRVAAGFVILCLAEYMTEKDKRISSLTASATSADVASDADDFVPLPAAPPLGNHEHVDVYRVRLSRTALSSFGVTGVSPHAGATLMADIVVGDDGIARGIRVIP